MTTLTDQEIAVLASKQLAHLSNALETTAHLTALEVVIVTAGIVTQKEMDNVKAMVRARIDQAAEERMRNVIREELEKNPGMGLLAKAFGATKED